MTIETRYKSLDKEINECARLARRSAEKITFVAVSKTAELEEVQHAIDAGMTNFGENRAEELVKKKHAFPNQTWHFIGNIQSRRIPDIVAHADLIHSLYKFHHIEQIENSAAALGKIQEVLIEVNVSGEASKGGAKREEISALLRECFDQPHVRACGFMTMAPIGDLSEAQSCFDELAHIAHTMRLEFAEDEAANELRELSMGMTDDWREAIAAGATIIRLGRAIFGDK